MELTYGVPQGSCAGPVPYNIYATTLNDLANTVDTSVMSFADDHSVYSSSCFEKEILSSTIENIQVCLKDVKEWMGRNRFMMNDKKTKVVVFGRPNMLGYITVASVNVGEEPVDVSSSVKNVGVWLDSTLEMNKLISDRCRIASLKLYNIRKFEKYLCHESFVRLINASVLSHLN